MLCWINISVPVLPCIVGRRRTRGNILPCWEAAVNAFQGRMLQQSDGGYTAHGEAGASWSWVDAPAWCRGCLKISVHWWRPWSGLWVVGRDGVEFSPAFVGRNFFYFLSNVTGCVCFCCTMSSSISLWANVAKSMPNNLGSILNFTQ